jgi:iron complex outermembrane receptor protein
MSLAQVFVNGEVTTGDIRHRILSGIDIANKEYFADWGQYHMLDSVGAEFDTEHPYYGTPVNAILNSTTLRLLNEGHKPQEV